MSEAQVNEALAFYAAHQSEIDAAIAAEQTLEATNLKAAVSPGCRYIY